MSKEKPAGAEGAAQDAKGGADAAPVKEQGQKAGQPKGEKGHGTARAAEGAPRAEKAPKGDKSAKGQKGPRQEGGRRGQAESETGRRILPATSRG